MFFILSYFHLEVDSRNPLPAQIYIYKYIYIYIYMDTHTHIRIHTYTYKCIYVYMYISICLWGREGAVMRRLKTMTSHRRWWDRSSWAGLGLGRKLIFLFYRSNIGGDSGFMISMRPGFGPTTFRPDSCLGQGLASSLEVAVGHSSEWPCRVNEHP